jgi:hypothetical protein
MEKRNEKATKRMRRLIIFLAKIVGRDLIPPELWLQEAFTRHYNVRNIEVDAIDIRNRGK